LTVLHLHTQKKICNGQIAMLSYKIPSHPRGYNDSLIYPWLEIYQLRRINDVGGGDIVTLYILK